eukprot:TRINITY_DN21627_c0_g1_i12.p1 TRINITY_DN21627_c0_g1~~TRINITY_DN21627_c0_g1_i12.p1  ORF type:complete len:632 (-),score=132.00 TRINITY_DN21627_c0_g1_i12:103-1944(-)
MGCGASSRGENQVIQDAANGAPNTFSSKQVGIHHPDVASPAVIRREDDDSKVRPEKWVGNGQSVICSGTVWKLNSGACSKDEKEWLQQTMWLSSTGALFYYNHHLQEPVGCALTDLEIEIISEPMLERYALQATGKNVEEQPPLLLAFETLADRDSWFGSLTQVLAAGDGYSQVDPTAPFTDTAQASSGRRRMSRELKGQDINAALSQLPAGFQKCSDSNQRDLSDSSSSSSDEEDSPGRKGLSERMPAQMPLRKTSFSSTSSDEEGTPVRKSFMEQMQSHLLSRRSSLTSIKASREDAIQSCPASLFSKEGTGVPEKMTGKVRRNSQSTFDQNSQTVIVLDWDDTIFPTTWIRKDLGLNWKESIREQTHPSPARDEVEEVLEHLSNTVEVFLREACKLAHVFIVTLATSGWVETSTRNFMPRLGGLLRELEIKVLYARTFIPEASVQEYATKAFKSCEDEADFWTHAKAVAMQHEFETFYKATDSSWKNLISIGDSDFERLGLLTVIDKHVRSLSQDSEVSEQGLALELITSSGHLHRVRAKTLKMLDCPSCHELIAELNIFALWLPHIIKKDRGLDIELTTSDDDNILNQYNLELTGERSDHTWMKLAGIE